MRVNDYTAKGKNMTCDMAPNFLVIKWQLLGKYHDMFWKVMYNYQKNTQNKVEKYQESIRKIG